ncbi:putative Sec1/Munc18 related protein [Leishmania major strain Friedlin]|uniref:Putative Sec1/Munc18 related protein n=1 Tax=Leishmania major TaxID=5664 RepID=Q4Q8W6_LEIMA|nr:putative Sec1/Munc18 related protein [Leishmania major strain Friedlin]CAG9576552.1 Sec1/Munc18_related_protein_-_putative [Leishmania major strain Friedlin]CAJ05565.1 putative Sec1/Munc18 related protein [Leishmania major strain Friedlin]|eukprot:XP_001684232.1 putative Sec1/Munc18 related protein [Leishmania major strain Friedlin]
MRSGSPPQAVGVRLNSSPAAAMPTGELSSASSASAYAGGLSSVPVQAGAKERVQDGKKATFTRRGILGCVKQRIFAEMLDPVEGDYNIVVCDNKGAEILSTCVRMHDLMDHGVTLVEDLGMPRQPVLSSAAIYLIEPTEESVRRVMNDWQVKNMYREAHVFFTSFSSERLIQIMASEPRLVQAIKTLKDMLLDFAVPESLLFNFCMHSDVQRLFLPDVALSGGCQNILSEVATRLVSVFFTIGAGVPTVQYQGNSQLAQQVARIFVDQAAQASRTSPATFRMSSAATPCGGGAADESPLLILVDRSFDAVEPLMHERTYQCLLNDLMPIENNIYEQTYEGRSGQEATRRCPIDEHDPYWCQYRHKFFPVCLLEFPKKLQSLMAANPNLVAGMRRLNSGYGAGGKLGDVGSAIRALPEFQEQQAKISLHIDICTKIMDHYKQQKLAEVCEVEQDVATGRRPFKELYDNIHRLTADVSLPLGVRVRLILLLIAGTNTREFSEAKKLMLLQEAGLSSQADLCNSFSMFISRTGQLPQEAAVQGTDSDASNGGGGGGNGGNGKNRSVSLARRSLRINRTGVQDVSGSPGGNAQANAANESDENASTPAADLYRNQAYLILRAAANGTLSTSDFPIFRTSFGGGRGGSLRGALQQRRTLRAAGGGNEGIDFGGLAGVNAQLTLDLGHEGKFALKTRRRIVLFVLGGVTYGEVRAAYEIAQTAHVEVFVGGTSLLTPDRFLSSLNSLR